MISFGNWVITSYPPLVFDLGWCTGALVCLTARWPFSEASGCIRDGSMVQKSMNSLCTRVMLEVPIPLFWFPCVLLNELLKQSQKRKSGEKCIFCWLIHMPCVVLCNRKDWGQVCFYCSYLHIFVLDTATDLQTCAHKRVVLSHPFAYQVQGLNLQGFLYVKYNLTSSDSQIKCDFSIKYALCWFAVIYIFWNSAVLEYKGTVNTPAVVSVILFLLYVSTWFFTYYWKKINHFEPAYSQGWSFSVDVPLQGFLGCLGL